MWCLHPDSGHGVGTIINSTRFCILLRMDSSLTLWALRADSSTFILYFIIFRNNSNSSPIFYWKKLYFVPCLVGFEATFVAQRFRSIEFKFFLFILLFFMYFSKPFEVIHKEGCKIRAVIRNSDSVLSTLSQSAVVSFFFTQIHLFNSGFSQHKNYARSALLQSRQAHFHWILVPVGPRIYAWWVSEMRTHFARHTCVFILI